MYDLHFEMQIHWLTLISKQSFNFKHNVYFTVIASSSHLLSQNKQTAYSFVE